MNKAALTVYQSILAKGDQKEVVDLMQTRNGSLRISGLPRLRTKTGCALFAQKKN